MERENEKGRVCVIGGTGFVASWLVMRLLQRGYFVNVTVRSSAQGKDVSYLTSLPGAKERLQMFTADLEHPNSFGPAIEGCIGVFHLAHPMDLVNKETAEVLANRSVEGTIGILQGCLDSKTVKRVVHTSSAAAVSFNKTCLDIRDENSWSDVEFVRNMNFLGSSYVISKTLTEKAALEFAEKHSLDVVTVVPTWIHGPFVCPGIPESVLACLSFINGTQNHLTFSETLPVAHTDDVASAHIFLFEYPEARGRYICSAVEPRTRELLEFLSKRYPQYQVLNADSLPDRTFNFGTISSKKLLDTGFRYRYGLEEIYDEAIECCKLKGMSF